MPGHAQPQPHRDSALSPYLSFPPVRRTVFFEREVARVNYVAAQALLVQSADATDAANPEAAAAEAAAAGRDDAAALDDDDGFDAKAEEEYRVLEAAFKLEFGPRVDGADRESRGADEAAHAQMNGDSEGQ
jgi:hypothetical protein